MAPGPFAGPGAGTPPPQASQPNGLGASLAPNAAADAARAELEGQIAQVRQVMQAVAQLGTSLPFAQPQLTQVNELLNQVMVSAAQQASAQTASASALPMNGGGM